MKAKVSNTVDGVRFGSCFVESEITSRLDVVLLKGFSEKKLFLVSKGVMAYREFTEITIDLSTQQPCIYACMREGLTVEVESVYDEMNEIQPEPQIFNLSVTIQTAFLLAYLEGNKPKSIKILDSLEGVEVIDERL